MNKETYIVDVNNKYKFKAYKDDTIANVMRYQNKLFDHEIHVVSDYYLDYINKDNNNNNLYVLDIGGHIGSYGIPTSEKCKKVYIFEPQLDLFNFITENINLNNRNNVEVINIALGTHEHNIFMSKPPEYINNFKHEINVDKFKNYGASKMTVSPDLTTDKTSVKVFPLDKLFNNFIENKIAIIKIDVEGAEKYVFYGAREIIFLHKPIIIFEDITKHHLDDETEKLIEKEMPDNFKEFNFIKFCLMSGYKYLIKINYSNGFLLTENQYLILFPFISSYYKFIKKSNNYKNIDIIFYLFVDKNNKNKRIKEL